MLSLHNSQQPRKFLNMIIENLQTTENKGWSTKVGRLSTHGNWAVKKSAVQTLENKLHFFLHVVAKKCVISVLIWL